MNKIVEKFLIPQPTPTERTRKPSLPGSPDMAVYVAEDGTDLIWSAKFPLPAIGSRVFITMNGIGWAVVKGYFSSGSGDEFYVGVMTLPTREPKWLRKQSKEDRANPTKPQWIRDGLGCEFGAEIALKRPVRLKAAVVNGKQEAK